MFDKRIQRGNTYAAMVIPAGNTQDTMVMEKKSETRKPRTTKKKVCLFSKFYGVTDTDYLPILISKRCLTFVSFTLERDCETLPNLPQQRHCHSRASSRKSPLWNLDRSLHWTANWQASNRRSRNRHWVLLGQTSRTPVRAQDASQGELQSNSDLRWRSWTVWFWCRSRANA